MGVSEIEAFLSSLAGDERVAASTQNQTLSALLFLSREVLHQDLGPVDALRARKPKCLLTVLVCSEARNLLSCLSGACLLIAQLRYSSGLCLMEALHFPSF